MTTTNELPTRGEVMTRLFTITEISEALGVPATTVEVLVRDLRIRANARTGESRLFKRLAVELIRAALANGETVNK
jgi:excisionase family DNA binding protein